MTYVHQHQGKWPSVIMRKKSIARVGCFLTCLAMKFSAETGRTITPVDIDKWMDANNGYMKGSDGLIWDKIVEYARSIGLGYTKMESRRWDQTVTDEYGMILCVDPPGKSETHFILYVDNVATLNGHRFLDPGTKRSKPITMAEKGYTPISWRILK